MEDHRPNTPVDPHGDGDVLDPHGLGDPLDPHGDGDPLDPHGDGNLTYTDDHDEPGTIIPPGMSLLATDPPPGDALISTEKGEVFLVEYV